MVKHRIGEIWKDAKFTALWAFGTPEQKAYCAAIDSMARLSGLERTTMQTWFDSAVEDCGKPWEEVYGVVYELLVSGETLANIYQQVLGLMDDEADMNA